MPLNIIRNDLTQMNTDAIVCPSNQALSGSGGLDGEIHRLAGEKLIKKCKKLGGCNVGEAKITKGYSLSARYIIHTVGPVYKDGSQNEEFYLRNCYRNSLALAVRHRVKSIAFPLISSGTFGYPKDEALRIADEEISAFLQNSDMEVFLVVFDKKSFAVSKLLIDSVAEYIDENYVEIHQPDMEQSRVLDDCCFSMPKLQSSEPINDDFEYRKRSSESFNQASYSPMYKAPRAESKSLEAMLKNIDESFSQMLLRKIDERGIKDSDCYKRANVDRKLFSKIRNNTLYRPSKQTAIAFAIALELDIDETKNMLMKAGYALSHSNKFDIIIEYFIQNRNYNIFEINEVLFSFDQCLLGA